MYLKFVDEREVKDLINLHNLFMSFFWYDNNYIFIIYSYKSFKQEVAE